MKDEKTLNKQIGERIRECRLEAGYSQSNLADILKFESPTAISLIEAGQRGLKIHDLIVISELFMKDYSYFLDGRTKKKNFDKSDTNIEELARRLLRVARHKKPIK